MIPEGDSGCNLYAYDLGSSADEALTDLSAGDTSAGGPQVQGVAAISEDGSHVYFVAKGVLTGSPNKVGGTAEAGRDNLYCYDMRSDEVSFIAALLPEDHPGWNSRGKTFGSEGRLQGPMQTTPDGRFLLFSSRADLTPDAEGEATHIYRYDSATGALIRVSIGENGFNRDGNTEAGAFMPVFASKIKVLPGIDQNPAISADGSTVVFATTAALTPTATEGSTNLYEYQGGHIYLIASQHVGQLAEIDQSGRDVFFTSTSALVPADPDTSSDLYDARIDGGFPAPSQAAGCAGDGCQPIESPAKPPPGPLTPNFQGGEEGPRHPGRVICRRGLVRRKGVCVRRRHRSKKHHRHHNAGDHRGGSK
jgi:Tol biopolymer transport system component